LNTSNNISTRITSLNSDSISDGSTNKFIVNGIYTGNVNIDGTLTTTDLIVPGTITTLNTEVYVTEQLQILNSSTGIALNIRQNNTLGDVFNASNLTSEVFTIKNNGNVGIGTDTPATKLHIQGDLSATGSISSFYSDERLKEDIKKIESPLNIIENVRGFYYKPNELAKSFGIKNDKREIGLSAQDVKKVLPEIVSLAPFDISRDNSNNIVSKSGEDYLTICYERMIPVIVEAIKELNNEIKELKRVNKEFMENN